MLFLLIPLAALLNSTDPESSFDHARFCLRAKLRKQRTEIAENGSMSSRATMESSWIARPKPLEQNCS
jgi:hypothetical protein